MRSRPHRDTLLQKEDVEQQVKEANTIVSRGARNPTVTNLELKNEN
jgi:hypothetical protein